MKRIPLISVGIAGLILVGAAFLFSSGWGEMDRSHRIEEEVGRLRGEAERIRGENRILSEQIDFFSTESFEEREAKEKLGMRNTGEEALSVEIGPFPDAGSRTASPVREPEVFLPEEPNYRKWLSVFGILRRAER